MAPLTLVHDLRSEDRIARRALSGERTQFPPALPIIAVVCWLATVLALDGVELAAHGPLSALSRELVAVAKILVIVVAGALYARLVRGAPSDLVLATGVAWLVFSIAVDVVTGLRTSGGYHLLGDPLAPTRLRDATALAWLVSPALFARRGEREPRPGDLWPSR